MNNLFWPALAITLFIVRLFTLRRFWRLPHTLGSEWCFDAPTAQDSSTTPRTPLLWRYRRALLGILPLDVFIASLLVAQGKLRSLPFEQFIMLLFGAVYFRLVWTHFSIAARSLSKPTAAPPATKVILAMTRRRLLDHTIWPLEAFVFFATACCLVQSYFNDRLFEPLTTFVLFFQSGLLLAKRTFIYWRMKLPARRTDDYRRWRTHWETYHSRVFDALRVWFALVTFMAVFGKHALPNSAANVARLGMIAATTVGAIIFTLYIRRERCRLAMVETEVQPQSFAQEFPPQPPAPGPFFLGGFVGFHPENPGILLRRADGIALNLSNHDAWLWIGYLLSLVSVLVMLAVR